MLDDEVSVAGVDVELLVVARLAFSYEIATFQNREAGIQQSTTIPANGYGHLQNLPGCCIVWARKSARTRFTHNNEIGLEAEKALTSSVWEHGSSDNHGSRVIHEGREWFSTVFRFFVRSFDRGGVWDNNETRSQFQSEKE